MNKPTEDAARLSRQVLDWARLNGLPVTCVDTDVLGGVAIYLGQDNREVWIACMDSGAFTAVLSRTHEVVDSFSMKLDGAQNRIIKFLFLDDSSAD